MAAEIIGVGPYSARVASFLDYRQELFSTTREGALMTRRLFGVTEGSSLSRELAVLVGVTDPWDFNQHHIQAERIDVAGLAKFSDDYPDYQPDVEAFLALLEAGFQFHFRPEG